MGEHKLDRHRITQQLADELAKAATDGGRLVEVGWIAALRFVVPKDASEAQADEMRKMFFLGAQHLYASVLAIMDADREITQQDLARMALIHDELEAFRKSVTSWHAAPGRPQ